MPGRAYGRVAFAIVLLVVLYYVFRILEPWLPWPGRQSWPRFSARFMNG